MEENIWFGMMFEFTARAGTDARIRVLFAGRVTATIVTLALPDRAGFVRHHAHLARQATDIAAGTSILCNKSGSRSDRATKDENNKTNDAKQLNKQLKSG